MINWAGPRVTAPLPAAVNANAYSTRWPIKHVIFIIKENRSFDQLFGRFPGANGARFGYDHGKRVPLKAQVDEALATCPKVDTVLVVQRTGGAIPWQAGRDRWYHEALAETQAACPPETMAAEDPLFILYTSASTGESSGARYISGSPSLRTEPTDSFDIFRTTASSSASRRTRSLCFVAFSSCCNAVSR